MIIDLILKRKIYKYLDDYSRTATQAEMMMSWQNLIGVAQREWNNTYIPARELYLHVRAWHKKRGRTHLIDAMNELNRRFQIKVMEDLHSEFLDEYRESKDSSYLKSANDCLRNASKIRDFPKKNLHLYIAHFLGG